MNYRVNVLCYCTARLAVEQQGLDDQIACGLGDTLRKPWNRSAYHHERCLLHRHSNHKRFFFQTRRGIVCSLTHAVLVGSQHLAIMVDLDACVAKVPLGQSTRCSAAQLLAAHLCRSQSPANGTTQFVVCFGS